jgi:hypothetical protein
MTSLATLIRLIGQWAGSNRLHVVWLTPPVQDSDTTASVSLAAQGQFLAISYTWAYEGKPQDGLLLIGSGEAANSVKAVWIDSWHMSDKFMLLEGTVEPSGSISMRGAYAAPPGPDWGWRIVIEPGDAAFRMTMHNISPEGEEIPAVEATFARVAA